LITKVGIDDGAGVGTLLGAVGTAEGSGVGIADVGSGVGESAA